MERLRRRFWTILVTVGAVLVIAAAAASGLFQVAVQAVPGYRADVERYVRDITGRPVRIGALGVTWRYYYPSLELIGVALLDDDGRTPLLEAERLRLGFSLPRLVRGDVRPNRLELHGLQLDGRIDRDGRFGIDGLDAAAADGRPVRETLRPLTQFAHVSVERCRVNVVDERRREEPWSFGIAAATLDRGLLSDEIELDVVLPAVLGDSAHFEATFTGELLEPATWSGNARLDLAGLVAGPWLAPYLARGATVELAGAAATLDAQFEQGDLKIVDARLTAGALRARRARHEAGFESLDARVRIERLADGWHARLGHLALATAGGKWPATRGELRATTAADGPTAWEARLDYARLGDLGPWLQVLSVPAELASLDGATGDVRDATVRIQGRDDDLRYAYRARFEGLSLPARERPVGFSGARGEIAGDERGGRAVLQESPVALELPGMLVTPTVPFEGLEAEVEWRRLQEGWHIGMPQFRWALWSMRGKGQLDLRLPEGRSPELDLRAEFSADDATRAKVLMPQRWGAGLRNWLDRSILAGRVPRATLAIKGPLADFPFHENATGSWALDIEAADIQLAYQADWPPVENLAATLRFRGNGLAIESSAGRLSGTAIRTVSARFPNFRTGELLIEGTVAGETARFYDFLSHSPLRDKFRTLLRQTTARGPATVDIRLEIPVTRPAETQVDGRVALDGVELQHAGLPAPLQELRGEIAFTDGGRVRAERLAATLMELPLEATLTPQPDGSSLLAAGFRLALDPAGKGVSELVPAWIRRKASGASQWRATLPLGGTAEPVVRLTTDLAGVAVALPAPLGKPPEQAAPLVLTIGADDAAPLHITAEYADRLGADLRFARVRQQLVLDRGALRLGAGPPMRAQEKGLVLGGHLDDVDARAWFDELSGAGLDTQMQTIKRADLHVGRARWERWALRDARYQWSGQRDGWTLSLLGAGGMGEVRWARANGGQLSARLDQLAADYLPAQPEAEAGAPADPNTVPVLDLDIRRLVIGPADLGHLTLATARIDHGQKLQKLAVNGGSVTLAGGGEWRRRSGQSSAALNADLTTTDIAALLRAFGYAPNLDARRAQFKGALTWAPSERGIEWHQARGTVHLAFENGQLRAVEPGAGRVLGLVNFYALPRRLTLNFRDVVSSGLGFDRVTGDFELADGNARTQNLQVAGPSLRMDVKGRIGLAARDYDEYVTVYPDVSGGVTLGAVLLGGPVAGVLALLAQEILDKPLNQVTQLTYRLTGSWDNPQVERAGPAPAREPAGPPAQRP